ncbi:MAG: hypothetical protein BroJett030_08570 [Alphaproteobacteria bacterium]|nr:MAG: hypothetical protein BroJett030_08570 [Alphaproteobacteria bacterium]
MSRPFWRLLILAACLTLGAVPLRAEAPDPAPPRAAEAKDALRAAAWEELETGLLVLRAASGRGLEMTALRIAPDRFSLSLALQREPRGERVETIGPREDAVIAINGGFFGEREAGGDLFPVGLLRRGGRDQSRAWQRTGGFLVLSDGKVAIRPTSAGVGPRASDIIQSKPLIIAPGGKWVMNTNQHHLRRRSIVCLQADGTVVLFVIRRFGLSLYEAGWLMRAPEAGGFFDCHAALALDGGGSTQLWVAGHPELSFRGQTPVHNALVVKRR